MMRELLGRWAKLEPGRCKSVENDYFQISRLSSGSWRLIYPDNLNESDLIWLQAAVQQAIVSRGWAFRLEYNPNCADPNNPYDAMVDGPTSEGWGFGCSNIAEPLLAAYLEAIEGC